MLIKYGQLIASCDVTHLEERLYIKSVINRRVYKYIQTKIDWHVYTFTKKRNNL